MLFVLRPLINPTLESFNLLRLQRLVRVRRRHNDVGIRSRCDPFQNRFEIRTASHIESNISLPICLIRTVAGDAVIRQDRPDIAVKRNRFVRGRRLMRSKL